MVDTVPIQNVVFELGKLIDKHEDMIVLPNSDTLMGLYFYDSVKLFKGDMNLFFSSKGIQDVTIKYERVRYSDF